MLALVPAVATVAAVYSLVVVSPLVHNGCGVVVLTRDTTGGKPIIKTHLSSASFSMSASLARHRSLVIKTSTGSPTRHPRRMSSSFIQPKCFFGHHRDRPVVRPAYAGPFRSSGCTSAISSFSCLRTNISLFNHWTMSSSPLEGCTSLNILLPHIHLLITVDQFILPI